MADTVPDNNTECSNVNENDIEEETFECHDNKTCESSLDTEQKEAPEIDTTTDSTSVSDKDKIELRKFEEMFKNRFTELDPGYIPYSSSDDAKAIPVVENFQPPWNSQNRDGYRGRGHGSHQQQKDYKRRHDGYRSHDNRQHRNSYHRNYHNVQHRQNQYRYNEDSNYSSRDQEYRRY